MTPIYSRNVEDSKESKPDTEETKTEDEGSNSRCTECGGKLKTDYQRGESVCQNCGLVEAETFIDAANETRAYTKQEKEKRARTGPPVTNLTHENELSTKINHSDINSRDVSPESRRTFRRIKKFNVHSRTGEDRQKSLVNGLKEISRICGILNIANHVKEATAKMYKELHKQDGVKGRAIEATVAAAIYLNCRKASAPKTLEEVSETSRVEKKKVGSAVRHVQAELGINIPPSKPVEYVPSIASKLNVSHDVVMTGENIAEKASDNHMHVGKNPVSIAAAATYLACEAEKEECTQTQVAEAATCTDATVRNRANEIREILVNGETDLIKSNKVKTDA